MTVNLSGFIKALNQVPASGVEVKIVDAEGRVYEMVSFTFLKEITLEGKEENRCRLNVKQVPA